MLSERRLERNKQWLEEAHTRFRAERNRMALIGNQVERPGLGTHMADQATEVFEQARDLAVCHQLGYTLELVDRALEKMKKCTYGACEACGATIDPARLKALPYATLCMSCQARQERAAPLR